MNYHDVMEAYKRPMSIKYIPRIFSWLTVFVLLFGVTQTAYAMDKEPVIWVLFMRRCNSRIIRTTIMTPEAERFNGWAAMLGFVAAVGAYATTGQIIPGIF